MIGIGGVSMSGIAAILKNWGFNVSGSDWAHSETTDKLNKMGIPVTIGHNLEDVSHSDDDAHVHYFISHYFIKTLHDCSNRPPRKRWKQNE